MSEFWYVTKWALTKGIVRVAKSASYITDDGYLSAGKIGGGDYLFVGQKHYTDDLQVARIAAEDMRANRIRALSRQIKKLEQYTPRVVGE